jgi:hypothetical protein
MAANQGPSWPSPFLLFLFFFTVPSRQAARWLPRRHPMPPPRRLRSRSTPPTRRGDKTPCHRRSLSLPLWLTPLPLPCFLSAAPELAAMAAVRCHRSAPPPASLTSRAAPPRRLLRPRRRNRAAAPGIAAGVTVSPAGTGAPSARFAAFQRLLSWPSMLAYAG